MDSASLSPTSPSCRPAEPCAVVGLGGNLGPVQSTFSDTILALRESFPELRVSRLYSSAPVGPPQPDFLNAAVLLPEVDNLERLLEKLHELEEKAGRVRAERWGARTLDLDILWAGTRVSHTYTLTVPHVELKRRAFALLPLLDLVPHAHDPIERVPYSALISSAFLQSIRVVSVGPWW